MCIRDRVNAFQPSINPTGDAILYIRKHIYEPPACLPCPPGYMHLKIRPSSSAWMRPAGVNSPPHFNIRTKEGSFGASVKEDKI